MRILAILLSCCLVLVLPAWATPRAEGIANMKSWCNCVMQGGVCQIENNPKVYRPGQQVFTTAGPIPAAVYNAIRAQGGLMCVNMEQTCTASWDGAECKGFRLMFRQEPMVCLRPGEPRRQ